MSCYGTDFGGGWWWGGVKKKKEKGVLENLQLDSGTFPSCTILHMQWIGQRRDQQIVGIHNIWVSTSLTVY